MVDQIKACIFDVDGTLLSADGKLSTEVLKGISTLRKRGGILTTVLTGRGYSRLREALTEHYKAIVGPDTPPVGLEHGGRISTWDGTRNLYYKALTKDEIDGVLQIPFEDVHFIGFFPEQPLAPSYIWTADPVNGAELRKRYGHNATIVVETKAALAERFVSAKPCMITLKMRTSGFASQLPSGLNFHASGVTINVIGFKVDKGQALNRLCELIHIGPNETLVAGDGASDYAMLALPDLAARLIVGNDPALLPVEGLPNVKRLLTPEELGDFLLQLGISAALKRATSK